MSNYRLKIATVEDWNAVLPMAKKFFETTTDSKSIAWDEESVLQLFLTLTANGFTVLAISESGETVGMLGCLVQPHLLNNNVRQAVELMWWVEPEHRKSPVGNALRECAEAVAKVDGCHRICMSMLDTSPDVIQRIYERAGYRLQEKAFVKEL